GRFGDFLNRDLAQYHVPTCADVRRIDAVWLEESDPHLNPVGAKGIGEIGIVGAAAAIGNAVHHATGVRVRDLPITPGRLLPLLWFPSRVTRPLNGPNGGFPAQRDAEVAGR